MALIAVVEDEEAISRLICLHLQAAGYEAKPYLTGDAFLADLRQSNPDVVLLDWMLPDMSGFALCQQIRQTHMYPIIMLTAKGEDLDKITGLTLGADDYMTKPFNPLELVARVKTQLRRYTRYNPAGQPDAPQCYDFAGLTICRDSRKCTLYDEELALTPIEFDILWYLCAHRGKVISSEELFEAVWQEKYLDNNNTVMAHIARLREKLHEPSRKPKFIKTVWGVGYTIA